MRSERMKFLMSENNPFDAVVTAIPISGEFLTEVGEGMDDIWEVVLNRGSTDGWAVGNQVILFALGPNIVDPLSEEDLGHFEIVRGRGRVTHVQQKMCTVRSSRTVAKSVQNALLALGEDRFVERPAPFATVHIGDFARLIG